MVRALFGSVVALVVALGATQGAASPLTECGGTILADGKGVLQNDVTCHRRCSNDRSTICDDLSDGDPCGKRKGLCEADQFVLEHGATLDLNGHVIEFAYQRAGAICGTSSDERGRCIVKGPGTIQGGKGSGIVGRSMDVIVKNITISFTDAAISTKGHLVADGLVIPHDRENSIYAAKGMTLRNVHLDGESGAYSDGDVTFSGGELGPHGGTIVAGGRLRGNDVTLSGGGGVTARSIVLRHASSEPNPGGDAPTHASASARLRLVDSDVASIESGRAPVLVRSTCETSSVSGSSASWGVCSND